MLKKECGPLIKIVNEWVRGDWVDRQRGQSRISRHVCSVVCLENLQCNNTILYNKHVSFSAREISLVLLSKTNMPCTMSLIFIYTPGLSKNTIMQNLCKGNAICTTSIRWEDSRVSLLALRVELLLCGTV